MVARGKASYCNMVARGKASLKDKDRFIAKLKLFDILNCNCQIITCQEKNCLLACSDAHIDCSCKKKQKLPKKELGFILEQRVKVGTTGSHQIGLARRKVTF